MKYGQKVMAAIFAGTMALGGIAPVAALADTETKTATGTSKVTITKPNVAEGDSNIKVTVPTSIPLAVDADDKISGPTTAGFTNTGTVDVNVASVKATLGGNFSTIETAGTDTTDANAVYLKISRANDKNQTFVLHKAVEADGASFTDWKLSKLTEETDVIVVDSESCIKNLNLDLTAGKTLATLNWSLSAQVEKAASPEPTTEP